MTQYEDRDPWEMEDSDPRQRAREYELDFDLGGGNGPVTGGYRPAPSARMLFWNANVISGGLLLFYCTGTVFIWIISLFPGLYELMRILISSPVNLEIFNIFLSALVLLIPALFVVALTGISARDAFPIKKVAPGLVLAGICCGMGSSVPGTYLKEIISAILRGLTGLTPTMPQLIPDYDPGVSMALRLVALSLIPAVFEELLFRGAILQSLRRFGDSFALVTSSLLFALAHRNLVQGPNAFVAGIVLGYFTIRTGSLMTSILMHLANNGAAGIVSAIAMWIPEEMSLRLNFTYFIVLLALGFLGVTLTLASGGFTGLRRNNGGMNAVKKTVVFFTAPLTLVFLFFTIRDIAAYFA